MNLSVWFCFSKFALSYRSQSLRLTPLSVLLFAFYTHTDTDTHTEYKRSYYAIKDLHIIVKSDIKHVEIYTFMLSGARRAQ